MCQGIPRAVIASRPGRVQVAIDGEPRWIKTASHISDIAAGEYVVVYAGVALDRVSQEEAEAELRFLAELAASFPEDET